MTTHSIIGTIQHPVKTQWQSQIYTLRSISRRRQWHPTPVLLPGKSMDRETWWAAVHGVMKSQTWLSGFTFTFHFHALEKEMATHSSVLAWKIPGTGEPGGLPSMGSHRVGHNWSDLVAAAFTTTTQLSSCNRDPMRPAKPKIFRCFCVYFCLLWKSEKSN